MKKRKTPDLEKYLEGKKRRFVNYTQGAKIYRMSYWPFVRLAKRAEANYPIRKTAIGSYRNSNMVNGSHYEQSR